MKKIILLALVLMSVFSLSAQREITGRITNAQDGSPIVGATIKVKGTSEGAITDVNGNYTLSKQGGGNVLVISSVGFKNREITLDPGQTTLDVSL
ncbi:MAG: carboxypeptidase-like regulatory domain-containing protein, partial [Bacteroidales bacterium]|nr:carboxypeptidase-like regulatory domain-containing protein [Bacteroidales bacterium]